MKTILLTISERLTILNALPTGTGTIQSAVIHSITNKIRFTSEEIDHAGLEDVGVSVVYDEDKPITKKITFDNCEVLLIETHLPEYAVAVRGKIAVEQ